MSNPIKIPRSNIINIRDGEYSAVYQNNQEYWAEVKVLIPERYSHADYSSIPAKIKGILSTVGIDQKQNKPVVKNCLYIHGPTGVGKTFIAYSIQLKLASQGLPSAFVETYDLLYQTQNELFQRKADYSIEDAKQYRYHLFLDDFGMDKLTDMNLSLLTKLLDYRYKNCLPTIFTSNFSPSQLIEKGFDDRMISRIVEMSEIIEITGKDKRVS